MGLALEEFDDVDVRPEEKGQGPAPEWLEGHAAGYAEAEANTATEQAMLSAALIQQLEDMAFGFAEARTLLMGELEPLFATLADKLLPALGDDVLAAHLAQALLDAAEEDLSAPMVLRVSVADVVRVSDLLALATHLPFTVRADPNLPQGSVLLSGRGAVGDLPESSLDATQLIDQLRAILSAYVSEQSEDVEYG